MADKTGLLRIVVLGAMVRNPLGGIAWHHLQYALGLQRLGHDVWFFEDSNDYEWSCYDPTRHVSDTDPAYGLGFADRTFTRVGLGDRWAYHDAHRSRWHGPAAAAAVGVCKRADLLLNLGHSNPLRPWTAEIPNRVLIDTDPVFTQVRHLTEPRSRERALGHTAFFTFGENLPAGRASAPDDGLPWKPTRQPVVTDAWAVTVPPTGAPLTTVMQWQSYAAREYNGRRFGMKSESFARILNLPERTSVRLELAVGGGATPRQELRAAGWDLFDPLLATADPWAFQQYVQRSSGEFTVAKHGYVTTRSGWFSERSANYLASGRPVITEETGFADVLPTGAGLVSFSTLEEAAAAVDEVSTNQRQHSRAARELACEHFDSGKVLTRLLHEIFASEPMVPVPEQEVVHAE